MASLPSGLPEIIGENEDLARFLFQSSHFNSTSVKPAAFTPNPKDRESSISRHGKEPLSGLWELGRQAANGRTLYGAALFRPSAVQAAGLAVESSEPPPHHAAIRGWPWDESDPVEQKARQKEKAMVLASQSDLLRCEL